MLEEVVMMMMLDDSFTGRISRPLYMLRILRLASLSFHDLTIGSLVRRQTCGSNVDAVGDAAIFMLRDAS